MCTAKLSIHIDLRKLKNHYPLANCFFANFVYSVQSRLTNMRITTWNNLMNFIAFFMAKAGVKYLNEKKATLIHLVGLILVALIRR